MRGEIRSQEDLAKFQVGGNKHEKSNPLPEGSLFGSEFLKQKQRAKEIPPAIPAEKVESLWGGIKFSESSVTEQSPVGASKAELGKKKERGGVMESFGQLYDRLARGLLHQIDLVQWGSKNEEEVMAAKHAIQERGGINQARLQAIDLKIQSLKADRALTNDTRTQDRLSRGIAEFEEKRKQLVKQMT